MPIRIQRQLEAQAAFHVGPGWAPVGPWLGPGWARLGPIWECCLGECIEWQVNWYP